MRFLRDLISRNLGSIAKGGHGGRGHSGRGYGRGGHDSKHGSASGQRGYDDFSIDNGDNDQRSQPNLKPCARCKNLLAASALFLRSMRLVANTITMHELQNALKSG